jgi:hypothetical protein
MVTGIAAVLPEEIAADLSDRAARTEESATRARSARSQISRSHGARVRVGDEFAPAALDAE